MTSWALAIVGAGQIARKAHVPALAASPDFTLAACVTEGEGLPGIPCFPTLEALHSAGPAVQAVALCTPPQVRARLARQAMAAGLHVLLEKPPAASVSECLALARAAGEHGVSLFATWHSRFGRAVPAAAAWLAGRQITGGHILWHEDVREFHPGQHWLWQPGGLGVFDPGINALSILTAICHEPCTVRDAQFTTPSNAHAPIAARLTLATGDAAITAAFDFRGTTPQRWSIELQTTTGTLHLEDGGDRLELSGVAADLPAWDGEYLALYARFASLIAAHQSDCDPTPLQLTADAFLLAATEWSEPFYP